MFGGICAGTATMEILNRKIFLFYVVLVAWYRIYLVKMSNDFYTILPQYMKTHTHKITYFLI